MKKILVSALLIAASFGFANAQEKQKADIQKNKVTALKPAPQSKTQAPVVKMTEKKTTEKTVATTHLKADGTADKRFKENKTTVKPAAGPLKKNGTPDMRYSANKKK